MAPAWDDFVRGAVQGEPDDPFVRLLRERTKSGYRVVRVDLKRPRTNGQPVEYRFLLEYAKSLSEQVVPHSPSLTRWTLEDGIRLGTAEDEAIRFGLLAKERFAPLIEELGNETFRSLLLERVQKLAPPEAHARVAEVSFRLASETGRKLEGIRKINEVLASLVRDLALRLGYPEPEASRILDHALTGFLAEAVLR